MTTLKKIKGAMIEFDLRSCEDNILDVRNRRLAHSIFLTGVGIGLAYYNKAIESCIIDEDTLDLGRLNQIYQSYAEEVINLQAQKQL